jgi:hypothetical protein
MSQKPSRTPVKPKPKPSPPPQTKLGRLVEKVMLNLIEPIDLIGKRAMGDYWVFVYLSIQDAIALAAMFKLPSNVAHFLIGTDFSGFDVCLLQSPLGVSRYACFLIVAADFCTWIVIGGRILSRFLSDVKPFN